MRCSWRKEGDCRKTVSSKIFELQYTELVRVTCRSKCYTLGLADHFIYALRPLLVLQGKPLKELDKTNSIKINLIKLH